MKPTASLIGKFIQLANGETLTAGQLKGDWILEMINEHIISVAARGSIRRYLVKDPDKFRRFIAERYGLRDLEATLEAYSKKDITRHELVKATGDSKKRSRSTAKGFLVNCYDPLPVSINGRDITLEPCEGLSTFVADYQNFQVPENAIVVGVENSENFRYISGQRWLFEKMFPKDVPLVFVCRYPQQSSLRDWLKIIPNKYVHFGDLDIFGIDIYQNEYYSILGIRASMLIPSDYEERIKNGLDARYDDQIKERPDMTIKDPRVRPLFDCILRYRKGYDQEGYIE